MIPHGLGLAGESRHGFFRTVSGSGYYDVGLASAPPPFVLDRLKGVYEMALEFGPIRHWEDMSRQFGAICRLKDDFDAGDPEQ